MAAAQAHGNGYVRLQTLATVGLPILALFAAAVSLFVSLSIAPIQKQLDQQTHEQELLRSDLVPRKEHDRDWLAQDAHFADIQRQVDMNREDIKSIYTPSDALKGMAERLDKLETELHDKDRRQP